MTVPTASGSERHLVAVFGPGLSVSRGSPLPFGAAARPTGVNFAVYSRHATSVSLALFEAGESRPAISFPLDPRYNRTGDVWHIFVKDLHAGAEFGWFMDGGRGGNIRLHRYDPTRLLVDPYVRVVSGGEKWARPSARRGFLTSLNFDWQIDQPLNTPLADSIIYELHVRGYTRDESSEAAAPGTFLGLTEKIPYLKQLGVTAVELLPVCEFDETENVHVNPLTGEWLLNFWGYSTIAFFAPKASYSASGAVVREFKEMVRRFHAAGIEIILDMVFNHTAEGDQNGPTLSFRGIDNETYYILDPATGAYLDFTGCGNTFNCNHPVVRDLILDCLRYWVVEMHVDGFRFDLASVLGRGRDGSVLTNPPLLEHLAADPILANTKLIAEAWDAAGLYQVGTFPAWGRWAEWNGKFRDDIRRFVRGDPGMVPALAERLLGSPDLYRQGGRQPFHSINFVTCHDGFTLRDLVSYNEKHNIENGEDNRDGTDANFSWNCGVEGPIDDEEVEALRTRQMKNLMTLLFVSHGVPMLTGGDEFARTQRGNNNAYCQDNGISWVDWRLADRRGDLLRFARLLIAFRRTQPALRRERYVDEGAWVEFHGVRPFAPDWSWASRSLAMLLRAVPGEAGEHIYVMANAFWEPLRFELPPMRWRRVIDTSLPSPDDIQPAGFAQSLNGTLEYLASPRSVVVLAAPR
jgi:glycogen operon protein